MVQSWWDMIWLLNQVGIRDSTPHVLTELSSRWKPAKVSRKLE